MKSRDLRRKEPKKDSTADQSRIPTYKSFPLQGNEKTKKYMMRNEKKWIERSGSNL